MPDVSGTPTIDEYVQASLLAQRARLREAVSFGPAGRTVTRSPGERVIYHPTTGQIIGRVVEDEHGNTQIEQDDKLHCVIRLPQFRTLVRRHKDGTMEVVRHG